MNCVRCNTPNWPENSFCRTCGYPIPAQAMNAASPTGIYNQQQVSNTVPAQSPIYWQQTTSLPSSPTVPYYQPALKQQPTEVIIPGTMPSTGALPPRQSLPQRPHQVSRWVRVTLVLAVFFTVLVTVWFMALRPYFHNLVSTQIDQSLAGVAGQMNLEQASQISAGSFHLPENDLNGFIAQNTSASDPVQHIQVHITNAAIRIEFQAYGLPYAISGVPQTHNGQLVVTNVKIEGLLLWLIMSPDEMTGLLNRHLADIQKQLPRPIISVTLSDHELVLEIG